MTHTGQVISQEFCNSDGCKCSKAPHISLGYQMKPNLNHQNERRGHQIATNQLNLELG